MRFRKTTPAVEPVEQNQDQAAEDVEAIEDTEGAVDEVTAVQGEAEQARAEAHQARTEAETMLATAREQAARLIADTEQQARALTSSAQVADRRAAALEERLGMLRAVEQLEERATEAEQQAFDLAAEGDDTRDHVDALDRRIGELGVQREDAAAALGRAREEGDVAGVTEQRSRLGAVDEVAGVLDGQREQARQRIQDIGDPDGVGELAKALKRAGAARAEQRRLRNLLYPDSPQAQHDALMDQLKGALTAQLGEMTEPAAQQHRIHVNNVPPIQEPPVAVNKSSTPAVDRLRKASSKLEDQVGVYDVNGNLIGICDPDAIVPVAQADDVTKMRAAEGVFKSIRKRQQG